MASEGKDKGKGESGGKGKGGGKAPPAPKAGAAPKAKSAVGGFKAKVVGASSKIDGYFFMISQRLTFNETGEHPQESDGGFATLSLPEQMTTAKWPEATSKLFFTAVYIATWRQYVQSHHFDEKEGVAELKVGDGRSEVQKEAETSKLTVEQALRQVGEGTRHGENFLARAEAWLATNASGDGEEEARASAWVDKNIYFPEYKKKAGGRGVSDEDRKKKEQELRRKSLEAAEKKREVQEHWQALAAAPVEDVPWETCQRTMHAGGGTGGCLLVELEGARAVCVKPQGIHAVSEFIAERVMKALEVPVASCRPVMWTKEEYRTMVSHLIKAPIMGDGSVEVVKMLLTGNSRFGETEEIDVEYVGVLEYVPGHGLIGLAAHHALAGEHANNIYRGLGRLCAADVLINNLDRVPLPIWSNDGNLSNVMVKAGGQVVAIDQQVNVIMEGPGRDAYLLKVQNLVADCSLGIKSKVAEAVKQALLENTGTDASDEALTIVVEELRRALEQVALLVTWGTFEEHISKALQEAQDVFSQTYTDLGQDRVEAMVAFVRSTASAVKEAIGK